MRAAAFLLVAAAQLSAGAPEAGKYNAAPFTTTRLQLSLEPNVHGSAVSPTTIGTNMGHRSAEDSTWLAFLEALGVNSLRLWGANGLGSIKKKDGASQLQTVAAFAGCTYGSCFGANPMYILANPGSIFNPLLDGKEQFGPPANSSEVAAGPWWGQDKLRVPVTDVGKYMAAVSLLRSWDGHNVANAAAYPYPPAWAMIDFANRNYPAGDPRSDSTGPVIDRIVSTLGYWPLLVPHTTCGGMVFSTLTTSEPDYWKEHWETFKWQYASAMWLWEKGISKIEHANEPDLKVQNACLDFNQPSVIAAAAKLSVSPQQFVDMYWTDFLAVRSVATQDAYADANADVAAGRRPCPVAACPVQLSIHAAAFSGGHVVTTPGILAGATVNQAYFRFPCVENCQPNGNWQSGGATSPNFPWGTATDAFTSFQVYSYHAYAKAGAALFTQGSENIASSINSAGALQWRGAGGGPTGSPAPMPVAVTEFAQLTQASFAEEGDSSDTYYMAARLGGQLVSFAQLGADVWHFKLSMLPMGDIKSRHVSKHGIHFGENDEAPYQLGDQTTSGAVLALLAPYISGARPLLTCTASDASVPSLSMGCTLVRDGSVVHLLLSNDCTNSERYLAAAPPGGPASCGDRLLNIELGMLSPHPSSVVSISEVSLPADTCMNASSSASVTGFGTRRCGDPAFGGAFQPFSATPSRSGYFGEVSLFTPVSGLFGGVLPYLLPAFGVARITLPLAAQVETILSPTADATVFAGANAHSSFAKSPILSVGTSATAVHDATAVSLLRFALTPGGPLPTLALLELTVSAAAADNVILLLVATAGRAWGDDLTWAAADWLLAEPAGVVSRVAHNYAKLGPAGGGGPGNSVVGHISVAPGDGDGMAKRVDVSRFVARAMREGADSVTFSVMRRFRKNENNPASAFGDVIQADDLSSGSVIFHSAEAAAAERHPRLLLYRDA